MLRKLEAKCLENIIGFVKDDQNFRPLTLEEIDNPFNKLDSRRTFMVLKGSYCAYDIVIGMLLNYDPVSLDRSGGTMSIYYRMYCQSPVQVTFTRETTHDRVTKRIGLNIEVEVKNSFIDDHYLIHTDNRKKAAEIATKQPILGFLERNVSELEAFNIRKRMIEFQRVVPFDLSSSDWIKKDVESLAKVAAFLNDQEKPSIVVEKMASLVGKESALEMETTSADEILGNIIRVGKQRKTGGEIVESEEKTEAEDLSRREKVAETERRS